MSKVGKYHITTYSRTSKRFRESTSDNVAQIEDGLVRLCDMTDDAPFDWFLVGGVGIDLYLGRMTRFHHDFDIEVPSEQVEDVRDYMEEQGYFLLRKVMTSNVPRNRRMAVYHEVDPSECSPDNEARFRLVKQSNGQIVGGELGFLSYIDVSFTKQQERGVEAGYHGTSFVLPVRYSSDQMVAEVKGHKVRLRNPLYSVRLKKMFDTEINRFDIDNLKKVIPAHQTGLV
jgi:hypothetical protein